MPEDQKVEKKSNDDEEPVIGGRVRGKTNGVEHQEHPRVGHRRVTGRSTLAF